LMDSKFEHDAMGWSQSQLIKQDISSFDGLQHSSVSENWSLAY